MPYPIKAITGVGHESYGLAQYRTGYVRHLKNRCLFRDRLLRDRHNRLIAGHFTRRDLV